MRFTALVKKELRECLPWLLLAAIIFLFFGAITIRARILYHFNEHPDRWGIKPGNILNSYNIILQRNILLIIRHTTL